MLHVPALNEAQNRLLNRWLPQARVVQDYSWGLMDTTVLRVESGDGEYIVKAGGAENHHIGREITGHETGVRVLAEIGAAPRCLDADRDANILVTEYLEGTLVDHTDAEFDPEVHQQAGWLLRMLHDEGVEVDDSLDRKATKKAIRWLGKQHRIPDCDAARAKKILVQYQPRPLVVVPSHGDYGPRNWLLYDGRVRIIDFGRFGHRPIVHDFIRMETNQWRGREELRAAFFDGYGVDGARELTGEVARVAILREAVATAAWAYKVGDEPFEWHGIRMVSDALAAFA